MGKLYEHDLKVIDVVDQPDGSAIIQFELTEEFMKDYIETYQLDSWDEEHFQNWVIDSIKRGIKIDKDGNSNA